MHRLVILQLLQHVVLRSIGLFPFYREFRHHSRQDLREQVDAQSFMFLLLQGSAVWSCHAPTFPLAHELSRGR